MRVLCPRVAVVVSQAASANARSSLNGAGIPNSHYSARLKSLGSLPSLVCAPTAVAFFFYARKTHCCEITPHRLLLFRTALGPHIHVVAKGNGYGLWAGDRRNNIPPEQLGRALVSDRGRSSIARQHLVGQCNPFLDAIL